MVVAGDNEKGREVQQVEQEKQQEEEEEIEENDEGEQQRRKESQPLVVRDTVVEVLLLADVYHFSFKLFLLKIVSIYHRD